MLKSKDFVEGNNIFEDSSLLVNLDSPISGALPLPLSFEELNNATFESSGSADLIITSDSGEKILVSDFFSRDVTLVSEDGGSLLHQTVTAFTHGKGLGEASEMFASLDTSIGGKPVAVVESIKGAAFAILANGEKIPLSEGSAIPERAEIFTAKGASLELSLTDGSVLYLGSNVRAAIDDLQFDADSESGNMFVSLLRGVFSFASGLIARDDPSNVKISTPTAEIGLRGTKIVGEISANGDTKIGLLEGRIIVEGNGYEQQLDQSLSVTEFGGYDSGSSEIRELSISEFAQEFSGVSVQNILDILQAREASAPNQDLVDALEALAEQDALEVDPVSAVDATDVYANDDFAENQFSSTKGQEDYEDLLKIASQALEEEEVSLAEAEQNVANFNARDKVIASLTKLLTSEGGGEIKLDDIVGKGSTDAESLIITITYDNEPLGETKKGTAYSIYNEALGEIKLAGSIENNKGASIYSFRKIAGDVANVLESITEFLFSAAEATSAKIGSNSIEAAQVNAAITDIANALNIMKEIISDIKDAYAVMSVDISKENAAWTDWTARIDKVIADLTPKSTLIEDDDQSNGYSLYDGDHSNSNDHVADEA